VAFPVAGALGGQRTEIGKIQRRRAALDQISGIVMAVGAATQPRPRSVFRPTTPFASPSTSSQILRRDGAVVVMNSMQCRIFSCNIIQQIKHLRLHANNPSADTASSATQKIGLHSKRRAQWRSAGVGRLKMVADSGPQCIAWQVRPAPQLGGNVPSRRRGWCKVDRPHKAAAPRPAGFSDR